MSIKKDTELVDKFMDEQLMLATKEGLLIGAAWERLAAILIKQWEKE